MTQENGKTGQMSKDDMQKYLQAWTDMMVTIWQTNIKRLHVEDTLQLRNNISGLVVNTLEDVDMVEHQFLQYGIYQDMGVGRYYKTKNNNGDLEFLDKSYREDYGLDQPRSWYSKKRGQRVFRSGKPRKPRRWYSASYYISVMVLKSKMADMYAEEFVGVLAQQLSYGDKELQVRLLGA